MPKSYCTLVLNLYSPHFYYGLIIAPTATLNPYLSPFGFKGRIFEVALFTLFASVFKVDVDDMRIINALFLKPPCIYG